MAKSLIVSSLVVLGFIGMVQGIGLAVQHDAQKWDAMQEKYGMVAFNVSGNNVNSDCKYRLYTKEGYLISSMDYLYGNPMVQACKRAHTLHRRHALYKSFLGSTEGYKPYTQEEIKEFFH